MGCIEVKPARHRGGVTRRNPDRRLRPMVMALEGRALLSTWTVTNARDDGSTGTLRWAIIEANNSSVPDTIAFSSLFDTPQTIFLTQGPLTLEGAATTTIAGPGATLLTINSHQASRVFYFNANSSV
jgi:hypothetical protein